MSNSVSVVIPAAGLGSRLGIGIPKALAQVGRHSILGWQLRAIPTGVEVIVVAGYRSRDVVSATLAERPDAAIVFNHAFHETGTAASVRAAANIASDWIVVLDGDLLVTPHSLQEVISAPAAAMGVVPRSSEIPVGARVDASGCVSEAGFTVDADLEWSGLLKIERSSARGFGNGHVFESLQPLLPIPAIDVDVHEIDFPADLARGEAWIAERQHMWPKES